MSSQIPLTVLKPCRWRGPGVNGRYRCSSPKVVSGPKGVPSSLCAACPYADHAGAAVVPVYRLPPAAPPKPVGRGLGTELTKLLASLGLAGEAGCGCKAMAKRMDEWGLGGCKVNEAEILDWMRAAHAKLGWRERLAVVGRAVGSGLAFRLDPLDPARGLLDEARRLYGPVAPAGPPNTGTPKRHLAYHLYPKADSPAWRLGIAQLRRRWPLFTGRKVISVVTDGSTAPADEVYRLLDWSDAEVFTQPNVPSRYEVATWRPKLDRLWPHMADEDHLFFGHAKGVTRPHTVGHPVVKWVDWSYRLNLDYWPMIERLFRDGKKVVAGFLRVGRGFPVVAPTWHLGDWHPNGTFFWVSAGALRNVEWWDVPQAWWGMEAFPSAVFKRDEAGTHCAEGPVYPPNEQNLYDAGYWAQHMDGFLRQWVADRKPEDMTAF